MDRVCIFSIFISYGMFLGDECSKHVASILSDKDSESVKILLIHVRRIQGEFSNGECEFFNEKRLVI